MSTSENQAQSDVRHDPDGGVTVQVTRDYAGGVAPTTAQRVWEIVSDFGGAKTIFPSMLRVYLTYSFPDSAETKVGLIRDMTFLPPDPDQPLSAANPLSAGIEQLVQIDDAARTLTYHSLSGLPVKDYQSVMEVTGDDACRLTWTSTFTPDKGSEFINDVLVSILSGGADQIAKTLGLD